MKSIKYNKELFFQKQSGVIKDKEDKRDWLYEEHFGCGEGWNGLNFIDTGVVRNQLSNNSCVAFSIIPIIEMLWSKYRNENINFSEMFLWYKARKLYDWENLNMGCFIRDAIKLATIGVCLETNMPYSLQYWKSPSILATFSGMFFGKFFPDLGYYRIQTLEGIKDCLDEGYPIAASFSIYNDFFNYKDGIIKLPEGNEKTQFNHAMLIVGYYDNNNCFIVKNSYGTNWGDSGYCYIDYEYLEKMWDLWTIREIILR